MKYVVDIHGELEGDYEIIGKYEERPQGELPRADYIKAGVFEGDLISREALLKEVRDNKELYERERVYLEGLLLNAPAVDLVSPTINVNIPEEKKQKLIEELKKPYKLFVLPKPEVTFERPQGEWIYDELLNNWKCSECGETPKTIGYAGNTDFMKEHFKFCNHCGADMRKEDKK